MKQRLFFFSLAALVFFYFKNAFGIGFFKDDLFFLNISKANSLVDFLNFFNPVKSFGYRPIPIELFYYLINSLKLSFLAIHVIIFAVYLLGIIFLYQALVLLTKNKYFSQIVIFLYSISFIHIFQLYAAWNFQEVCLFSGLSFSFYFLLKKKQNMAIVFFIFSLLSKETAIFYPLLLLTLQFAKKNLKLKLNINLKPKFFIIISLLSVGFILLVKYEIGKFAQNPLYAIHLEPRLILNNLMWLGLWSFGLPIYLPDYMPSIFGPPLPDFYKALATINSRLYFYILLIFLAVFFLSLIYLLWQKKHRKELLWLIIFCFSFFTIFNLPTLPTIHKTMIRLTIPLLFISLFQAKVIYILFKKRKIGKLVAVTLLLLYAFWNYFGTIVHESASTYILESAIYFKSKAYFDKNRTKILKNKYIFLKDSKKIINPWGGSKKLNDTYWGQNFVQYQFPEKKLTMIYNFQEPIIPKNAFVVSSSKLLPYKTAKNQN